jgi:hypothetical protein
MVAMVDFRVELSQVAIGGVGALISEVLHWHRIARRGRWPKYARSLAYWLITLLVIVMGGAVAALVSPAGTTPTQLLLLGMVGPQLLQAAAQSSALRRESGDAFLGIDRHRFRDFLAS